MNVTMAEDHAKYQRLRYVAENFQSLQGLAWVCFGGGVVLLETEDIPGIVRPRWLELLSIGLSFGLLLAAIRYIPRYYERRFGSVERRVGPPDPRTPIFALAIVVMFLVILFFGPSVGRYLDSVVPEISNVAHQIIFDPDRRANLSPVLYLFTLLCAAILNRSHFGRLRTVFIAACLFIFWTGFSVLLPVRYPTVTQQMLWRLLNAGWLGISLMMLGLYDHLTLVHLLPARGRTDGNE